MSSQQESTAVAVARAHVEAWGSHEYENARTSLAPDVRVVVTGVVQSVLEHLKVEPC